MMMPAQPRTSLILGQPGLGLPSLETLFNPMLCSRYSGKLSQRRVCSGVGKMVIVTERPIFVGPTNYDQQFLVANFILQHGDNPPRDDRHGQWPLFGVPNFNLAPSLRRQGLTPSLDFLEWRLGWSAMPRIIRGRFRFQVANRNVSRNSQQVLFVAMPQFPAKPGRKVAAFGNVLHGEHRIPYAAYGP